MNETRKKIIINEIQYWKKNRLLPDQYCNYLLALYHNGEEQKDPLLKRSPISMLLKLMPLITVILTLIVNYFTELSYVVQLALDFLFFLFLLIWTAKLNKNTLEFQISLTCLAFTLLLATVKTIEEFSPHNNLVLYSALIFHCGIWIYVGYRLRIKHFIAAGIIGGIIIAYFFLKTFNLFFNA